MIKDKYERLEKLICALGFEKLFLFVVFIPLCAL